ncbi:MAG: MarR family transcriptional regulator [Clostridia bacterium]|jgi:DNA-binding MarR family transcriptional regulator|nr:MarR family transcriptional regulator [Clostridia bacterium]MBR4658930.1 MarR family transcriptional regulator [Clostridia bacterium]MBR6109919.1 MarR family transcriptional regulator [Clostridia bacterium]
MKLDWMGENRGVVEALIRYCNIYAGVYRTEKMEFGGVSYSYSQIQVVEYLLENEERGDNMAAVAKRLGITRSNFTKIAQRLEQKGLVEKKCMPGCRRDQRVEVTELGRELYEDYSRGVLRRHFTRMFEELDKLSPEARAHVQNALMSAVRSKE